MAFPGRRRRASTTPAPDALAPDAPAPDVVPAEGDASPTPAETTGPDTDQSALRGVAQHRAHLLAQVTPLPPFGIGLLDAAGLTLCESIVADLDLPVFTSATTAGWAVRGSNLVGASERRPVLLPLVGRVEPGGYRGAPLTPGTTVEVVAGAPLPEGADAVVPLAAATLVDEDVEFTAEAAFGDHLLLAGSRVSDGEPMLPAGTVLDARSIGLLAELGLDKVLARPRPRVVVASVGADLVEPGLPLERLHQTYDATTAMLAATARGDGAEVFAIGVLPEDPALLQRTLSEQLLRADLVLLAASATETLAGLLDELGEVDRATLAVAPAMPGLFARIGDERTPVLVLPGEAVAAYLCYQLFGRPLLRRLGGVEAEREAVVAPILSPVAVDPTVTTVLLARRGPRGVTVVEPGAAGAVELAAADTLVVVEPGESELAAHGDVTCWPLVS
jgi:molybdopterin molybdotransferase